MLFSWELQNGTQDFHFSIVLVTEYSYYVKSIATYAPTFFWYIISVLVRVFHEKIAFKVVFCHARLILLEGTAYLNTLVRNNRNLFRGSDYLLTLKFEIPLVAYF